jgi:hypothetical protein
MVRSGTGWSRTVNAGTRIVITLELVVAPTRPPDVQAWAIPASDGTNHGTIEIVTTHGVDAPLRPEWMDDETWDLVERAAAAGILAEAPTGTRPTVEDLEADARAFSEAIGGHEGARTILDALADGRS